MDFSPKLCVKILDNNNKFIAIFGPACDVPYIGKPKWVIDLGLLLETDLYTFKPIIDGKSGEKT